MARTQREISVAEFFAKNRHLLGYDNPSKALLTAVREAVDNALDACEEAGILPDIEIELALARAGKKAEPATGKKGATRRSPAGTVDRYRLAVTDNGPGIVRRQISRIFGKLLYGSKFHRLRMSRGQQGIGISAAALYGQLTTGKPIHITSRTSKRQPAHVFELQIDTRRNEPHIVKETETDEFPHAHGTRLELELEGRYAGGTRGIFEYLRQTALANPHAQLRFLAPGGELPHVFARALKVVPEQPREIQPHPYGVELGTLMKMLSATKSRRVSSFLKEEFCRVSDRVAQAILQEAGLPVRISPKKVARGDAEKLHAAMNSVRIMAPPTDCLAPIGPEALEKGIKKEVEAEFYTSATRSPAVYRGHPFQIEVALAYGAPLPAEEPAKVFRFANRVPLLYQQGACAMTKAVSSTAWRSYGLQHPKGGMPVGPLAILVHIASVWVPFTSESKEAVASYDEISKEIRLALQECGRRVGVYVNKRRRLADAKRKTDYITKYLPTIAEALRDLLELNERQQDRVVKVLGDTLRRSRKL
ncbi:MAG: DNA topoisomerase VI subunit B [Planctomycetota bacterium]|jgi:DNA topoisomerase-6 subunit B